MGGLDLLLCLLAKVKVSIGLGSYLEILEMKLPHASSDC